MAKAKEKKERRKMPFGIMVGVGSDDAGTAMGCTEWQGVRLEEGAELHSMAECEKYIREHGDQFADKVVRIVQIKLEKPIRVTTHTVVSYG